MKSTKRTLVTILMLAIALTVFAGCAKKEATKGEASTAPAAAGKKDIVLGFAQIGMESGWRGAETDSIKDTFKAGSGFELKFSDGQQKQENQIKAIRTFIAQKVDAIGLAPIQESGWETVLQEAKDAGIPVFLLDRGITKGNEGLYTSFIGSDFIEEGKRAADWLIKEVGTGKPLNIVQLEGGVGASAANDRKKGFEDAIKGEAGFKVTKSQTGEWTIAKGKEVMESFLKTDKTINALYAHNDDMGLGAIQAIEEAGLKPGKDIKIMTVDGTKAAFEAIKAGKLNVVVECNPLLGPQLKQAVLDTLAGKTVEKWIKSDESVFSGQAAIDALDSGSRKY